MASVASAGMFALALEAAKATFGVVMVERRGGVLIRAAGFAAGVDGPLRSEGFVAAFFRTFVFFVTSHDDWFSGSKPGPPLVGRWEFSISLLP